MHQAVSCVGGVGLQLGDRVEDEVDGLADGRLDLRREPQPHLLDLGGLAGDHGDLARRAADGLDEAQHRLRVHRVGVDRLAVVDRLDLVVVGVDHVERPRLAALPADVDESSAS